MAKWYHTTLECLEEREQLLIMARSTILSRFQAAHAQRHWRHASAARRGLTMAKWHQTTMECVEEREQLVIMAHSTILSRCQAAHAQRHWRHAECRPAALRDLAATKTGNDTAQAPKAPKRQRGRFGNGCIGAPYDDVINRPSREKRSINIGKTLKLDAGQVIPSWIEGKGLEVTDAARPIIYSIQYERLT